ncbi:unnamed protein product [Rotaria sp. Silwood2]|nr:unnamed protein product [Rotaria sp. Silwood2]
MTARSLSVYLRMIINNGSFILTTRSIAEMRIIVGNGLIPFYSENSIDNANETTQMATAGLGWYWSTLNDGHQYFGHTGGLPGLEIKKIHNF